MDSAERRARFAISEREVIHQLIRSARHLHDALSVGLTAMNANILNADEAADMIQSRRANKVSGLPADFHDNDHDGLG